MIFFFLMRLEREEFPVSLLSVNSLCLCVFLSMLKREIVEIKEYRFDAIITEVNDTALI